MISWLIFVGMLLLVIVVVSPVAAMLLAMWQLPKKVPGKCRCCKQDLNQYEKPQGLCVPYVGYGFCAKCALEIMRSTNK